MHLRQLHDRLRRSLRDLAPEIEHDQTIDHGEQGMHDVLDPQDRDTGAPDIADGCDELQALALGQPAGDLVQEQKPRRRGQRAGHLEPLAFEQGERARERIGALQQTQPLKNLAAGLGHRGFRRAAAMDRTDQEILEHGELLERLRDLMGAADAGAAASLRRHAGEVAAVEADVARGRRQAACDQVEQRGLARAVRPDDADRFARRDREIEILGDDDRAEAFPEAGDFQQHGTSTRRAIRQSAPSSHRPGSPALSGCR